MYIKEKKKETIEEKCTYVQVHQSQWRYLVDVVLFCSFCCSVLRARAREREREKEEFMHLSSNITTTTTPPVIGKASDHETTLSRARHAEKINERKLSTMIDQN